MGTGVGHGFRGFFVSTVQFIELCHHHVREKYVLYEGNASDDQTLLRAVLLLSLRSWTASRHELNQFLGLVYYFGEHGWVPDMRFYCSDTPVI